MINKLKFLLAEQLEPWELKLAYNSYDIVGDIAVIRVPEPLKQRSKIIAEAVIHSHKRLKAVLRQTGSVSGSFRLRGLELVLGERKTETVHKEYGCVFKVDLEKCYFSPRLSYERMRIARQVRPDETILNMFAGVGCYSIVIGKHSKPKKIFSIDTNSFAIQYMRENIRLNRVKGTVVPIQGDSKKVIRERLQNTADRIIMPLPEKAYEYLDYAVMSLKPTGGWIHYYAFEHAKKGENPIEKIELKSSEKLHTLGISFIVELGRIVRTTGPNWYQVVLDLKVKEKA